MVEYRAKRVLITGANGFVGAHMVARLIGLGAEVSCLLRSTSDRARFEALGLSPKILICDLEDRERLEALVQPLAVQYVFHLAAERDREKLAQADDERRSACAGGHVMAAARSEHLLRFISVGTSLEVAGPMNGQPSALHGKSKARELAALRAMAQKLNIPYAPTRTHYVYGPLQSPQKLVPVAIRALRQGVGISLTAPQISKRYVYVLDLIEALLQVPDLPVNPADVHLITSPQQLSNLAVVETIAALMGKPCKTALDRFAAREFDREDWDLSEAGTPMPGWQPKTSLVEGLRACIAAEVQGGV